MKAFYMGYLLLAFVLLQSSSQKNQAANISTRLSVVHPVGLYYLTNNQMQTSIIDNDGNMYVTKWDLGSKSLTEFEDDVKSCEKHVHDKIILGRVLDFREIKEDEIRPSVFKEHGQCIISRGYILKEKKGLGPDKFKLSTIRTHSKSSSYIPVGATFHISKSRARYVDAYKQLAICDSQAKNNNEGIKEEYGDEYISVTIKPYVDSIKACFENAGYAIEPVNE